MKTYYIYEHNNELLGHNSDPDQLRKDVAEQFHPDEPESDIIEVEIETYQDSLYLIGARLNGLSEKDFYDIISGAGFDMGEWEYIETEFYGDGLYRVIFHQY